MVLTCEHCERLQAQLDTARELLRAHGIEGFGELSEGVLRGLKAPPPFELHVDEEVVGGFVHRVMRKREAKQIDTREIVVDALVLVIARQMAQTLHVDLVDLMNQLKEILDQATTNMLERLR